MSILTRAAVEVDMDTLGSQKTTCWPFTKHTNPQVSKGDPFGDDIRLSNSDSEIAKEIIPVGWDWIASQPPLSFKEGHLDVHES